MDAIIMHSPVWEHKKGKVIKNSEPGFVTVQIIDKHNPKLIYDVRFPRLMVKLQETVAEA